MIVRTFSTGQFFNDQILVEWINRPLYRSSVDADLALFHSYSTKHHPRRHRHRHRHRHENDPKYVTQFEYSREIERRVLLEHRPFLFFELMSSNIFRHDEKQRRMTR